MPTRGVSTRCVCAFGPSPLVAVAIVVAVLSGGCASEHATSRTAAPVPQVASRSPGIALPPPNLVMLASSRGEPLDDAFLASRNNAALGAPPNAPPLEAVSVLAVYDRSQIIWGQTRSNYRAVTRLIERTN